MMPTKTSDFRQEDSSDSPYLRRQRPGVIRRRRMPSLARRLRKWVLFLLLTLVGGAGAAYWFEVRDLNLLSLFEFSSSGVRVQGNRYVTRQEILENLDLWEVERIFDFSIEPRRKKLEEIAWIREAYLIRLLPNKLGVLIEEREPVAFVQVADRVKLVDSEGVLLEIPPGSSFDFPVLTGWNDSTVKGGRGAHLLLYEGFIRSWEDVSQGEWSVSEVDVSDLEDLRAVLVGRSGSVLVHFGRKDFSQRFLNFLNFIPRVHLSQASIQSVDLRFRNQIVVNPKF